MNWIYIQFMLVPNGTNTEGLLSHIFDTLVVPRDLDARPNPDKSLAPLNEHNNIDHDRTVRPY